ncbi:transposase [Xenorhabdus miraniensis]|uniref:transposase n=1 Tax=Xenorhabdus miraniensis TaxID=351674 RepID=UPI00142E38FC|nr:transposase [Xenorhabdus miraniensis]
MPSSDTLQYWPLSTSAALMITLSDRHDFKNDRYFSSYLRLVPKEYSGGRKIRQMSINKRADYFRVMLIHGVRSVGVLA